jgi:hypothetical protein
MRELKVLEQKSLPQFSGVSKSHVVVREDLSARVSASHVEFPIATLRENDSVGSADPSVVFGRQFAIAQDDLVPRCETGMKGEDDRFDFFHISNYSLFE